MMPDGPRPDIEDVQPRIGPVGARITITGTLFRDVQSVTFGAVKVSFSVKSEKKIVAIVPRVPVGTTFPDVTVETATGAAAFARDLSARLPGTIARPTTAPCG